MTISKRGPIRFSLVTVVIWLAVAAGIIFLLWQVITHISAKNLPVSTPTPNLTQVYRTIAAILTDEQTVTPASIMNTQSLSSTQGTTYTPTSQSTATSAQSVNQLTFTPNPKCDQAAAGNPIDVTIPDDSLIPPGQSFIKTWKLVNIGSCTWTSAYSANFFYGDRMEAPESAPLSETVPPHKSLELSIEMIAPLSPGTYQGNWKLSNPSGELFGIGPNGDAPFWVRIIVAESPTNTPSPTLVVTATSTPNGQASGELSPLPGDTIDLDKLTLNQGDEDLDYRVDASQYHWLAPKQGALVGIYGNQEPTRSNCATAGMSPAPIAVESLSAGTYLCYTTNLGKLGKMLLEAVNPNNFTLTLDLFTWAAP
jgi:Ig-like domain from next to BRCA1 gene